MSLDNVSAVDLACTNTTVVRALWSGKPAARPAVWLVELVEKGVLLLETEPWLVRLVSLHELGSLMAVVELVWGSIGVPALGNDQDVRGTAEWIRVKGHGAEVDVGVVAGGLASRRAIKVPLREVLDLELAALRDLGQGLQDVGVRDRRNCSAAGAGAGRKCAYSPWTWNEHRRWSQSRCTCPMVQYASMSRNPLSDDSLGHCTSLLVKGHVLQQLGTPLSAWPYIAGSRCGDALAHVGRVRHGRGGGHDCGGGKCL